MTGKLWKEYIKEYGKYKPATKKIIFKGKNSGKLEYYYNLTVWEKAFEIYNKRTE